MLDADNEVEYSLEEEEEEEYTMTYVGNLIFVDKHCRQSTSMEESKKRVDSLSLAYEDISNMPYDIIEDFSCTLYHLDISHNFFSRNLHFLTNFDNLRSLNLDHNRIDENTMFPYIPTLELLWLNNNHIQNLYPFMKNLQKSMPNLKYLSIMGNDAAPSYLNGGSFYDYLQYRLYVLSWFPTLVHLDDRKVTEDQRREAVRLFKRPLYRSITLPEYISDLRKKLFPLKPTLASQLVWPSKESNLII
ncbi:uncharacterized protein LOC105283626 isoform X2 [Ooceraea biroi]|uniref:Leucine-rich repeat-containing protein C10orf11-like protein n=1 Tax=Ooceraea biroi TaxID=2015173 RepID=A0A026W3M3_OOCBI|nr:uncharacterized protein LOC105283626 isoform X2 [Ooceraea biroi]EZA50657.1 Leucine-rich repeat-containing protein C10orf11-like protein [Ooceraea biroi]